MCEHTHLLFVRGLGTSHVTAGAARHAGDPGPRRCHGNNIYTDNRRAKDNKYKTSGGACYNKVGSYSEGRGMAKR